MLCSLFCNLNKPWKLCTRWNQLFHRTPFQSPVQDQDAQEDADAAATGFEAEYVVYQHLLSCLLGTTVTTPFEVKGTKDRKFRRGWCVHLSRSTPSTSMPARGASHAFSWSQTILISVSALSLFFGLSLFMRSPGQRQMSYQTGLKWWHKSQCSEDL